MGVTMSSSVGLGRAKSRKARFKWTAAVCLSVFAFLYIFNGFSPEDEAAGPEGRRLLSITTYKEYEGVCDSWLETGHRDLAIIILILGVLYMFWGLAIVCDDFFVASPEVISEELYLSEDVAGATFMAAGSSAPELFTSIMGVFAVHSDVGIGTIVGSAVFNLCCIIGGTALFTPFVLKIDWKPITRDTLFYGMAIALMIYVLND